MPDTVSLKDRAVRPTRGALALLAASDWESATGEWSGAVKSALHIEGLADLVFSTALHRCERDGSGAFFTHSLKFLASENVIDEELWQRGAALAEDLASPGEVFRCRQARSMTVGQLGMPFGDD